MSRIARRNERGVIDYATFGSYSLSKRGGLAASDCARPTSTFQACALREHVRRPGHPRTLLFALNRDVHDVPLPIDQQERQIGWLNRIGESLKHVEVGNRLTIELQYHVARLETGGFSQTAFFNVGHHDPTGDRQIHLPSQRRGHIVEDDAREGVSRGS